MLLKVVRAFCGAAVLLGGLLASMPVAAHVDEPDDVVFEESADLRSFEAPHLAEDAGISEDEAYDALMLQDRISELQRALYEKGPGAFGGLFIEYQPDYAIVILAEPSNGEEVRRSVEELGFSDLDKFVSVRETPLVERALLHAQEALGRISDVRFTWSDIDLVSGKVLAPVETEADVEAAREAIAKADLGSVPPENVVVFVSGVIDQHSYGGLDMNSFSTGAPCTSGFTVKNVNTNDEGVANADHCAGSVNDERLGHHSGTALTWMNGKNADSQDVQWYKTPGIDDLKQFTFQAGSIRATNQRKLRADMIINQQVCHYGRASGGGCGFIASKSFDPDTVMGTNKFNATFIRVDQDNTSTGDSGGPWFLENTAYGIHKGATFGGGGVPSYPFFMPQEYMSALNIQVRITGD